ncbi:SAM-dependent methyltransferase, partial [Listeria monocytogenes]|nr:SAM-dependent methyltransferase [Listeria monocytogenes]
KLTSRERTLIMMKITKRKKITLIILGGIIGLSFI